MEENTTETTQEQTNELDQNTETTETETTTDAETTTEQTSEQQEPESASNAEEGAAEGLDVNNPQEFLEKKGFDFTKLQEEYKQNKGFTEETKSKLAEIGITEEVIENYTKGQEALAEKEVNELAECVGGREKFDSILKWAGKNLQADEIDSIGRVTDPNIVKIILRDLNNRMEEKEGKLPDYVTGKNGTPSVELFESKAQMQAAILDPRYAKDEAYRRTVMKRISASRDAGKDLGC